MGNERLVLGNERLVQVPTHSPHVTSSGRQHLVAVQVFPFRFSLHFPYTPSAMGLWAWEATGSHGEAAWKLRGTRAGTDFHRSAVDLGWLRDFLGLVVGITTRGNC